VYTLEDEGFNCHDCVGRFEGPWARGAHAIFGRVEFRSIGKGRASGLHGV
jgi:hypothetical protein